MGRTGFVPDDVDLGDDVALRPVPEMACLGNEGGREADTVGATSGIELQGGQRYGSLVAPTHGSSGLLTQPTTCLPRAKAASSEPT